MHYTSRFCLIFSTRLHSTTYSLLILPPHPDSPLHHYPYPISISITITISTHHSISISILLQGLRGVQEGEEEARSRRGGGVPQPGRGGGHFRGEGHVHVLQLMGDVKGRGVVWCGVVGTSHLSGRGGQFRGEGHWEM
jgi:hypothetical protein